MAKRSKKRKKKKNSKKRKFKKIKRRKIKSSKKILRQNSDSEGNTVFKVTEKWSKQAYINKSQYEKNIKYL